MPRILLVDDEESFRYAAQKALQAAGFNVLVAPSSYEALDVLEKVDEPLDLLMADIVMPDGVNGFALARMARMRRRDIKVLYVTGHEVPSVEAAGKVLRKPITESELIEEVKALLAA